jgi:hypothetical protein
MSSPAFAEIEPLVPSLETVAQPMVQDLGTSYGTDDGLGIQDLDAAQDLDQNQNLSGDPEQLSDLLTDKIRTTQAMHAGDEEVSEPVRDDYSVN